MQDCGQVKKGARKALGCAVLACALGGAGSASAALGPEGVRAGKNVTVFHNIDFVAAFGHGAGDDVQVDVFRGGHRIATARGPAVPLGPPEGGALEVNHGVEGVAGPGDCWEGGTPDVQPGDLVRVTSAGGVDEVIVDDIDIDSITRQPGPDAVLGNDDDEVWVEGDARSGVDGSPLDVATLDSGEFRDPLDNKLRLEPNEVVAGAEGRYVMKYRAPFTFAKGSRTIEAALTALERDGHAFGYGHVPLPDNTLRPDGMLVEGMGTANGAAVGCESSGAHASSVGTASARALNVASLDGLAEEDVALSVGGWAAAGTAQAEVEVSDELGGFVLLPVQGLSAGAARQQGWSAHLTAGALDGLAQGVLELRLLVDGVPVGASREVRYDIEAPTLSVDLPAGSYTGTQHVTVSGSDHVAYRLGDGPFQPVRRAIALAPGEHVLTLRAHDEAGNVTEETRAYTIAAPPAPEPQPEPKPDPKPEPEPQPPVAPVAPVPAPVAAPAPTIAVPQVLPAPVTTPRPVATMVRSRIALSERAARRAGLTVRFDAPDGAVMATVRAYRLSAGRRALIASRSVRIRAGRITVAFASRTLRRQLAPGRYAVDVVLRGVDGTPGAIAAATLRITR